MRENPKTTVTVLRLGHQTGAAILVIAKPLKEGEAPREIWLPLSCVHEIHRTEPPKLVMDEWLAEAREL